MWFSLFEPCGYFADKNLFVSGRAFYSNHEKVETGRHKDIAVGSTYSEKSLGTFRESELFRVDVKLIFR